MTAEWHPTWAQTVNPPAPGEDPEYDREMPLFVERLRQKAEAITPPQLQDVDKYPDPRNDPDFEAAPEGWRPAIRDDGLDITPSDVPATLQHPPLAAERRILERFADEVLRIGVVGERHIIQLIFLVLITRHFDRVVNLALKGPSAGGKSFLVERVLSYFPESAYYVLSSMSEHALVYDDEPLVHRMLVIYEAAGMAGDLQTYFIRSLLSEGRIRYVTVVKTKNGIEKKLIDRAGPTGLLTTTTEVQLHPEYETRLLSATVTDTPEQTKAIMLAQAGFSASPDVEPWHALHDWLGRNVAPVVIPYASALAERSRLSPSAFGATSPPSWPSSAPTRCCTSCHETATRHAPSWPPSRTTPS